jgi:hypothetical protein
MKKTRSKKSHDTVPLKDSPARIDCSESDTIAKVLVRLSTMVCFINFNIDLAQIQAFLC